MNDISRETILQALEARHFENLTYQQTHIRKAIAAAEDSGSSKARVDLDVLRETLPKAHRVSS